MATRGGPGTALSVIEHVLAEPIPDGPALDRLVGEAMGPFVPDLTPRFVPGARAVCILAALTTTVLLAVSGLNSLSRVRNSQPGSSAAAPNRGR